MNAFILINKTFAETNPESAENSSFSDIGMVTQDEQVSFRELVDLMKKHREPSQTPHEGGIYVWFSTGFYTKDHYKGIEREECIHYSQNNTPNAAKYWKLAARIAHKH